MPIDGCINNKEIAQSCMGGIFIRDMAYFIVIQWSIYKVIHWSLIQQWQDGQTWKLYEGLIFCGPQSEKPALKWQNKSNMVENNMLFVSPELSSGRDLVIQMSVRRAPSAVCCPLSVVRGFLSGAYLGNRMTYLDDIWYVGGARSEVAHAEFWAWQMPIKYLICIIYAKICPEHFLGTVCPT